MAFAKGACRHAISEGCTPIAVHLLYPQMLDDCVPAEREIGLQLGYRVLESCDELWACGDRISSGMAQEIAEAKRMGIPVRSISEQTIEQKSIVLSITKQSAAPVEPEQAEAPQPGMRMV